MFFFSPLSPGALALRPEDVCARVWSGFAFVLSPQAAIHMSASRAELIQVTNAAGSGEGGGGGVLYSPSPLSAQTPPPPTAPASDAAQLRGNRTH